MDIREDDLTGPQIIALLREHLENMHAIHPPAVCMRWIWRA